MGKVLEARNVPGYPYKVMNKESVHTGVRIHHWGSKMLSCLGGGNEDIFTLER